MLLRCTGCGSTDSMEEIKRENPRALSCCPERSMAPIVQYMREADAGTDCACWVPAIKGDPGAVMFIAHETL